MTMSRYSSPIVDEDAQSDIRNARIDLGTGTRLHTRAPDHCYDCATPLLSEVYLGIRAVCADRLITDFAVYMREPVPLCFGCAKVEGDHLGKGSVCEGCGRRVYGGKVCSSRCAQRVRRRRKQAQRTRACEVCSELFTPSRSDAKVCSNKCRQAAHRRRHRAA